MKRHIGFAARAVGFCIILTLTIILINKILVPKYYYNDLWPTTSTYAGFYRMDEDSIDVLCLGSSHAAAGFNPQVIYDAYGIRSYNLACEQQNMFTSYYWIKEALRYQKPQVILFDTYMLFPVNQAEALNSAESCTRKAFDGMRWSGVKAEAVKEMCRLDEEQSEISYYLPNVRYHTRWTELKEEDFRFVQMNRHYELKGYTPLERRIAMEYQPFVSGDNLEQAEMVPLMQEYLNKIVELCENNEIKLILFKTPSVTQRITNYNTVSQYAAEKGLEYWDFNEASAYKDSALVFEEDMNDDMHMNIWGAQKLSLYIGFRLQGKCEVVGRIDEQWESTKKYYQDILNDCQLKYITDIHEYLPTVNQERYTIFLTVLGDGMRFMDDETLKEFRSLGEGLAMDYEEYGSCWAVIDRGSVLENAGMSKLTYHGSMRNHLLDYEVISGGAAEGGYTCSVKINDMEAAVAKAGINIVVYNNTTMKVIDSVCYNGQIVR